MMKFDVKTIHLDGLDWINLQNQALKQLEAQKEVSKDIKIDQKSILEAAKKLFIREKRAQLLVENIKEHEDRVYFMGVEENPVISLSEITVDLRSYYVDDLSIYDIDQKPTAEFKINENIDSIVQDFVKGYLTKHRFLIDVDKTTIEAGDFIHFEIYPLNQANQANQKTTYVAHANNDSENEYERFVVGKEINKEYEYVIEEHTYIIKPVSIFKEEYMPITEDNFHLLKIDNFKTFDDVIKFIEHDAYYANSTRAIFDYGQEVVGEILKTNGSKLKIPSDLLDYEANLFEVPVNQDNIMQMYAYAESFIANYFWTNVFQKKLGIAITEENFNNEMRLLKAVTPKNEWVNISTYQVTNIVLFKKVGQYFAKKYYPEAYAKIEKYLDF
ncbi:hypothetical protein H9M94_03380 [Mycoplasma sp. Pen4]|uniref:trigger factor-related chaperone n=1 Tax=Mycoplasma sp. Pen4 TaxID=640330 RepID=UPI0016541A2A|nr:hypothetical protein [Mycoplasma sp. Pen4]QNM93613.1 hypothetical protein H9M94_03380 [Mycoplasma sp. Pen4]